MNKITFFAAALLMLSACGDDDAPAPVDMGGGPVDMGGDDAGPADDAGPGDDAGPADDAGPGDDAGPDVDAGPAVDGGPASPTAMINHPGDGETRPAATPILFVGVGMDIEDGPLTGASLVWTSDLDGMIGTGLTFMATLSAGTNVVTLTATDSVGNTATDTVTLTITP